MFKYKNYIAKPEVDADAGILHGRILNISDTIPFSGKTVEEAKQAFYQAVDGYIEACKSQGREPDKPFSGKLPFRTTPEIHRDIYIAATRADKSINAWMEEVLGNAAKRRRHQEGQALEDHRESELSIAEYRRFFIELEEKFKKLQDVIKPFLKGDPEELTLLAAFLDKIEPALKDPELQDMLLQVRRTFLKDNSDALLVDLLGELNPFLKDRELQDMLLRIEKVGLVPAQNSSSQSPAQKMPLGLS